MAANANQQRQQNSAAFFQQAKAQLRKLARVDDPNYRPTWMGPVYGPNGRVTNQSFGPSPNGMFNVPYGIEPNDVDVQNFIAHVGGNPYETPQAIAAANAAIGAGGQANRLPAGPGPYLGGVQPGQSGFRQPSALDALIASMASKTDQANAANDARFNRKLAEQDWLRQARQSLADNWGQAAMTETNDRMLENLGNIRASQAARGFANSSNTDAFAMRNAHNTNLALQKISEMRDERKANYLKQDTEDLLGTVERRVDQAPDYAMLANLAMQFGESGNGMGYGQQPQPTQAPETSQSMAGGGGGYAGGGGNFGGGFNGGYPLGFYDSNGTPQFVAPAMADLTGGVAGQFMGSALQHAPSLNDLNNRIMQPAYVANRYPVNRHRKKAAGRV